MRAPIYLCLMVMLMIGSCRNDNVGEPEPEVEEPKFPKAPIDCERKQTVLDSLGTAQALIGTWEWKYASCGWKDPSDEVFKGVKVKFSEDGMMTITGDGEPRNSQWSLTVTESDNKMRYWLDIDPVEIFLVGYIVHCESYVMFGEKYVDGCDNTFKKVE